MIDAISLESRGVGYASCSMNHGQVNAVSQQSVAGEMTAYQVIPPYLVQVTPDEINVYTDLREVTLLMGSGGPSYA